MPAAPYTEDVNVLRFSTGVPKTAIFCNFNFLSAGMDTPVEPQQVQPIVNVNLSEETPNQEGGNCAC